MFIMPDFIRTPEEWIIWLLAEEFHGTASIEMIVQRTRYGRDEVISFVGGLERMKAVRVNRNARDATVIDSVGLVPNGRRISREIGLRSGQV